MPLPIRHVRQVTIAEDASLSGALSLSDYSTARIDMPAGWDAAALTFQVSADGTTWLNLYDSTGAEYAVAAAASTAIILPPSDFLSAGWLKIRSGTAGSPVVQTAARTLTVVEQYIL